MVLGREVWTGVQICNSHHKGLCYNINFAVQTLHVSKPFKQSQVQAGLYTAAVLSTPGCVYGHVPLHNILMPLKHGCTAFSCSMVVSLHQLTSSVHASKPPVTFTM